MVSLDTENSRMMVQRAPEYEVTVSISFQYNVNSRRLEPHPSTRIEETQVITGKSDRRFKMPKLIHVEIRLVFHI